MLQPPHWVYEARNKLRRTLTHTRRRLACQPRIIASLTSYPPRIGDVNVAIESLLAQKTLPDKIVLWLYKGDFPNGREDLPRRLIRLLAHDVEIRWVDEDLKPHKKYFWAMQEFPDDIIITFDDDLIYRNTLITDLVESYRRNPKAISAARAHLITLDAGGDIAPYADWEQYAAMKHHALFDYPSSQLLATHGAGALFPPHIMPPGTFHQEGITTSCLYGDDLWLKTHQLLAGVPVVSACIDQQLTYIPDSQECALFFQNIHGGRNDQMLSSIIDYLRRRLGKPFDMATLIRDVGIDKRLRASNGHASAIAEPTLMFQRCP